jgi:hypothetical protein
MYVDYTKETREFTIRGQACKFVFVRGEERDWSAMDDESAPADMPSDAAPAEAPSDAAQPADSEKAEAEPEPQRPKKGTGKQMMTVQGRCPGKSGEVTINLRMPADQYQEDKIVDMLQSIR